MPVVTDPMQFACRQLLRARDHFLHRSGLAGLDAYGEASDRLFAAFTSGWQGT